MKRTLIIFVAVALAMFAAVVICEAGGPSGPTRKAASRAMHLIEWGDRGKINTWKTACTIARAERLARWQGCPKAAASFSTARIKLSNRRWADAYTWIRRGRAQALACERRGW